MRGPLVWAWLIAKMLTFAVSQESGFVGGPIFPALFIGGTAGVLVHQVIPGVPLGRAFTCLLAAVPGSLVAAPFTMVLLAASMTQVGALQTAPLLIAVITAFQPRHPIATGPAHDGCARVTARAGPRLVSRALAVPEPAWAAARRRRTGGPAATPSPGADAALAGEGEDRGRGPVRGGDAPRRSLALERFLQLAGDFVGRGIHVALHYLVGFRERLVERLLDRRLAHRDQSCLAGGELPGQLVKLLARQGPAAEPFRDDTDARAIQPFGHVGFAVLLVDHRRVDLADHLVLVQLLDGIQVCLRGREALVTCGVDHHGLLVGRDISLISGHPTDGSTQPVPVAGQTANVPLTTSPHRKPHGGKGDLGSRHIHMEEIASQQAVDLRTQERPPSRAAPGLARGRGGCGLELPAELLAGQRVEHAKADIEDEPVTVRHHVVIRLASLRPGPHQQAAPRRDPGHLDGTRGARPLPGRRAAGRTGTLAANASPGRVSRC